MANLHIPILIDLQMMIDTQLSKKPRLLIGVFALPFRSFTRNFELGGVFFAAPLRDLLKGFIC